MDRNDLKKTLHGQFEPLEIAVQKKLAYLASDDVFNNDYSFSENETLEDAFAAFTSNQTAKEDTDLPINKQQKPTSEIKSEQPTTETINYHKQSIAAKIAALRGISLPGDYLTKKY